jgi:pyruvate/2-oxoglutarate/acetoin dehydrogenase E1 component
MSESRKSSVKRRHFTEELQRDAVRLVTEEKYSVTAAAPPSPYGFAAEIAALVSDAGFNDLDAPIRRLTGAFAPTP